MLRYICCLLLVPALAGSCSISDAENKDQTTGVDSTYLGYPVDMANTVLIRYPDIWSIEDRNSPKWSYTYGLLSQAMLELWTHTGNQAYFDFARKFADALIDETGRIDGYNMNDYNLDNLCPGKILFNLFDITKDPRYSVALETLRDQLTGQPRTEIGGFWHKQRYPHQMWLDGLYMGGPFYAQYVAEYGDAANYKEIVRWFVSMEKVSRDTITGLLYHGWDEARLQAWADPVSGCSPSFWGRGMGWYAMALVDVLDFLPEENPGYGEILQIIVRLAKAICVYQDKDTGCWYQVVDQGQREGNYLEGSATSMFSYFLLKSLNKGYLDKGFTTNARFAYEGLIDHLTTRDSSGLVTISPVCAVAGLGGDPYRDGSYEYYINEMKRDNDPKAVGPFILAGLQYEALMK